MSTLAIELSDAGVRVANAGGILAAEPACASLGDDRLVVGSDAAATARLEPHRAADRYWTDLSLDPLPRPRGAARTNADIAHAQLAALWDRFRGGVEEVVLVVAASFSKEQLALLLGIAEACEMPVAGLVDAAVASSEPHPSGDLLHLELGLHRSVVARIEQGERLARASFEILEGVGLAALREHWMRCIARAFVLQTRFDPLHHAEAEQALYGGLSDFTEAARRRGAARIELGFAERVHIAEVRDADLAPPPEVRTALAGAVERLRRRETTALVQIGPRAAAAPGLPSVLCAPRLETREVAPEAACRTAIERLAEIRTRDGRFRLVTHLPSPHPAMHTSPPPAPIPTHVVYRGWAHAIGDGDLALGPSVIRGVRVDEPGAERDAGCTVRRDGGRVFLEPRGGVLLNGEPIAERAELRVGDVLQLGARGEPIQLVALVERHGA